MTRPLAARSRSRVRLLAATVLFVASTPVALVVAPAIADDDSGSAGTPQSGPPAADPTPASRAPVAGPTVAPAEPVHHDGASSPRPSSQLGTTGPTTTTPAKADPIVTLNGPGVMNAGDSGTFVAKVSGLVGAPTGRVDFGGGISGCNDVHLVNGKAKCTAVVNFSTTITATYGGDNNYNEGFAEHVVFTVTGTTTTLTASPEGDLSPGDSITLTATVASDDVKPPVRSAGHRGTPAYGNLTFAQDGSTIASCTEIPIDSNGQATCVVHRLAVGRHSFVASYGGGSESYGSSTSAALRVAVVADTPPATPHPVVHHHHHATASPAVSTTSTDPGVLPDTGNPVNPALLWLGGLTCVGGIALIASSRRRVE